MSSATKYICLKCKGTSFAQYSTFWECDECKAHYVCFKGMPKLYLEADIGDKDKSLRDYFYNGLLGKFYQFLMPFLTLPARPFKISRKDWMIYLFSIAVIAGVTIGTVRFIVELALHSRFDLFGAVSLVLLAAIVNFFAKHPYFFYLFLLAIPVKISLSKDKYQPAQSFRAVHDKYLEKFIGVRDRKLQVLDISTGTGNSLFRHGWMKLNAEYTGLDLSETMLAQCQQFMTKQQVPIDLVIGDATNLPFGDRVFDIVMNYGAINGYSDIRKALAEMRRVVKPGGLMLFLDEQLYEQASGLEKLYFRKVLSSHNVIHKCPVDMLPSNSGAVNVYQVYEFYYICACSV